MAGPLLSRDDLDELSETAAGADDPAAVAAQLAEAASNGRIADPVDAGYAYLLAAEIHERVDDLAGALALAERALAAYRQVGDDAYRRPRAYRAQLLLQLGHDREAMTELAELRPLMVTDEHLAAAVPEALEAGGRGEVALEWLTGALAELRPDASRRGLVAGQLLATRDRLRASLDAAPGQVEEGDVDVAGDEVDEDDPYQDDHGYDFDGGSVAAADAVLLVWPEAAYEQVDQRWPEVLEPTGAESWDDYRRYCQAMIAGWPKASPLFLVTGDADEFGEWLAEQGADPFGANLVALARGYGDHLAEQVDPVELPPGRDDPCWCGSGVSYAQCCRLLSPR